MLVHLNKRIKFLRVRLFDKRTNTIELPTERFTNCSLNVWFVCSPKSRYRLEERKHYLQDRHRGPPKQWD
ncbi:hypothetical protein Hanom_Chr06g00515291 [Helianthus anomalus]